MKQEGVREGKRWRIKEGGVLLWVREAQPYHGALCDGALGIPGPQNSLIEKCESSHTEKMAPQ